MADRPSIRNFLRGIGNAANANRPRRKSVEDGPELIIVVMGATGTGKSSLINALTGKRSANVNDSLGSEVNSIKVTPWTFSRRRFKLVDTPGFDDTNLSDTTVLKMIADFLQALFGRRVFVNGIIYLHRIIDPRMTGSSAKNLQLLQDLCGNEGKNVLLVTTFWDLVPRGQGENREAELASKYWQPLIEIGSRMHRYRHKSSSSGEELILDILNNQSNVIELQLQSELAQANTLLDTVPGKRLQEGLNHQLEQLEITLNQVQGEQRAIEGRRNTGRNEKTRVDTRESRIVEEIATIDRDLEILGMPRYIAMQEIDNRVAEIFDERCKESRAAEVLSDKDKEEMEVDAFWDLYGAFDEEDIGVDGPRESFGANRVQPVSPGFKQPGYGDSQFARGSTDGYSQPKPATGTPRAYVSPQVERRGTKQDYDSQQRFENNFNPRGQVVQQIDSNDELQAFNELSINSEPQFGRYDEQQINSRSNFMGHGQRERGRDTNFDEYGNPLDSAGGQGNQYRRDSRGH